MSSLLRRSIARTAALATRRVAASRVAAVAAAVAARRRPMSTASGPQVTQSLKGKTALITGSARGLGYGIAELFAAQGARVAIVDMNEAGAVAAAKTLDNGVSGTHAAFKCDVTSESEVESTVAATVKAFGKLDIVVSNAGHQYISPVVDLPFAEWKKMLAVHLDGSFLFTRAALRHMYARADPKSNDNGKIVLMGSIHSKEASVLKSPYVTAKHGLLGLTRTVAKEAGPKGIACNLVCPGFVRTELVNRQIPEQAKTLGVSEEHVIKNVMLLHTVDKEFTTVDDIARATLFFAAHPNNALTGMSLNVSHGWKME